VYLKIPKSEFEYIFLEWTCLANHPVYAHLHEYNIGFRPGTYNAVFLHGTRYNRYHNVLSTVRMPICKTWLVKRTFSLPAATFLHSIIGVGMEKVAK